MLSTRQSTGVGVAWEADGVVAIAAAKKLCQTELAAVLKSFLNGQDSLKRLGARGLGAAVLALAWLSNYGS